MVFLNPIGTDITSGQTRRYRSGDILSTAGTLYVSKSSHGFSVLDAIRHDGTTWVKAQANSDETLADGLVVSVLDANSFIVANSGFYNISSHGLTPLGDWLFLSESSAGNLVVTPPSEYVQPLLKIIDENNISLHSSVGSLSASGTASGGGSTSLILVASEVLTSPSNVMQVTGLNLNNDEVYLVYYSFGYTGASSANTTFITYNDDTSQTDYYKERMNGLTYYSNANDSTLDYPAGALVADVNKRSGFATLMVSRDAGADKSHMFMYTNSGAFSLNGSILKYPVISNVTKLAIRSTPMQLSINSYLKVYCYA